MTDRAFSTIFSDTIDAAAPVTVGETYPADGKPVLVNVPATGGPFIDSDGDTATLGDQVLVVHPTGGVIQAAADITVAEFLAVRMVDVASSAQPIEYVTASSTITLPPATGSGEERLYVLASSAPEFTLAPTTGEQVNGVVDASRFYDKANAQIKAVDVAVGQWNVGPALEPAEDDSLVGEFVFRMAESPGHHVFEMNGQTLVGGVAKYGLLAAQWPAWVSGADLALPDWRGRAMMSRGSLGITGASGALYSDATSQNGLNFAFYGNGSGNGGTHDTGSQGLWGGTAMSHSGPNRTNAVRRFQEDAETRPNAIGLVLCVRARSPIPVYAS